MIPHQKNHGESWKIIWTHFHVVEESQRIINGRMKQCFGIYLKKMLIQVAVYLKKYSWKTLFPCLRTKIFYFYKVEMAISSVIPLIPLISGIVWNEALFQDAAFLKKNTWKTMCSCLWANKFYYKVSVICSVILLILTYFRLLIIFYCFGKNNLWKSMWIRGITFASPYLWFIELNDYKN